MNITSRPVAVLRRNQHSPDAVHLRGGRVEAPYLCLSNSGLTFTATDPAGATARRYKVALTAAETRAIYLFLRRLAPHYGLEEDAGGAAAAE